MFKSFNAKLHGVFSRSEGAPNFPDTTINFTKNKVWLKSEQLQVLFSSPFMTNPIATGSTYKFSKEYNREDKKVFTVVLENDIKFVLDIDWCNKIKANILHHRYWIMKEIKWLVPVIISVVALVISIIALKQPSK